ncbi:hypothetical protein EER27_16470 [Lysobacter psychrotolerans]|uniref:Uncharacterized protein n=2 Tax=Montanilutibacter psychrotolerans TaxID=1327343 RepID=A0A3M8SSH2_9GAMM|nr:hypothetical protein EER27_16470 [Lysobacter psychrotolerans]
MELELARSDIRQVYVIPTTQMTLDAIPKWMESTARLAVVAPSVAGGLTPEKLLEQLKSPDTVQTPIAVVFSDQLVSPVHAPLLVEHLGTTQYLPALEVVAHLNYGLDLRVWVGDGFDMPPPECAPADVLRLLLRYQAGCQALGDRWLMRESQETRSPANRVNQARRRLRLLHSLVMHEFQDSPLPADYRSIVSRIGRMHKHLVDSARAA